MLQELKFQLSTALLTVFTAAALIAAGLNFQQLHRFHLPDDGVTWVDAGSPGVQAVTAYRIASDSGAARAGLRGGDVLLRINSAEVKNAKDAARILYGLGIWREATYTILRQGVEISVPIITGESPRDRALFSQYATGLHLPDHRAFRLPAARQRVQVAALLPFLPGLVYLFDVSLHREAKHVRLDRVLGQRGDHALRAGSAAALLPHLSGAAIVVSSAAACLADLSSGGRGNCVVRRFLNRIPGKRFALG